VKEREPFANFIPAARAMFPPLLVVPVVSLLMGVDV